MAPMLGGSLSTGGKPCSSVVSCAEKWDQKHVLVSCTCGCCACFLSDDISNNEIIGMYTLYAGLFLEEGVLLLAFTLFFGLRCPPDLTYLRVGIPTVDVLVSGIWRYRSAPENAACSYRIS